MSHSYRPLRFTEFKKYPICIYPWYKERLSTKYLDPKQKATFLNPKDWTFLKYESDQDDLFVNSEIIKGDGSNGPALITKENSKFKSANAPKSKKLPPLTQEDIQLLKMTRNKRANIQNIEEIELGLIQHSLALFPHLETSVQAETYEDIVDIVDPEMNIDIDDLEGSQSTSSTTNLRSRSNSVNRNISANRSPVPVSMAADQSAEESSIQPPLTYRWTLKKEESDKQKRQLTEPKPQTIQEWKHIEAVTQEFCEWVAGLGGQTNNIEQPTVLSLFASGYETKPALSVPIHVMELTSLPPELRGQISPPKFAMSKLGKEMEQLNSKVYQTVYGDFKKMKFGAWYLPMKYWKLSKYHEPLTDPRLTHNEVLEEKKAKFAKLNGELAAMHSPALFEEFTKSNSKRKPKFLEEVADIKRRNELDSKIQQKD